MSERTVNRGGAATGAILVTLGVAGLWFLLGDEPETPGRPETGASPRSAASASLATSASQAQHAPGARPTVRVSSSEPRPEERPDGELEVEVFSGNTPLPGAQIQVYEREPGDPRVPLEQWIRGGGGASGADGRWEVPVAPGSYYVTARAPELAAGYAAVVHPSGSAHTRVRLRLGPGAELTGSVLAKGTGEPVSLAELVLTPPAFASSQTGSGGAPEEESLVASSSATGEFRFPGVAPGRYRLEARAPGYVTAVLPSAPVPFPGGVTLLMVRGGQLEGTVLGADGQPAARAEMLAAGHERDLTAVTDSEGHFSLEAPPGSYALSARRGTEAGTLEQQVAVTVGQRVQGLRLQLGAGASISGKLLRKDGAPVLGARIEASAATAPRELDTVSSMAGTDASGAFSLSPLAAGTYALQVFMPEGTRFVNGPIVLTAGEHASLTLTGEEARAPANPGVTCSVLDASDRPVQGILVRARALWPRGSATPQVVEGRTDANGRVLFEGLTPGPFRMEIRPEGSAPGVEQAVLVSQGGSTRCHVWLPDTVEAGSSLATVEGRVQLRSGAPPDEAVLVDIVSQGSSRPYQARTRVDAQGRFQLAARPGSYTLRLLRQRGAQCDPTGERQLQLGAGQHLETMLLLEEREPDLRLRVVDAEGAPLRQTEVRVHLGFTEFARTDEQGRLDVCLPPSVQRQHLPGLQLAVSTWDDLRSATVEVTSVPRELTLPLRPRASVQGRLVDSRGAPVRRFTLDVLSPPGAFSPRTYEFMGDRFELPGFPVGPSLIVISVEGGRTSRYVSLQAEERKTLELPLYPGVSMTGRIIDSATRQPVASARVSLPLFGSTPTGQDGRFAFRNLPVGESFLYVYSDETPRARWLATQLVKLSPDQDNDVGDIAVPPR